MCSLCAGTPGRRRTRVRAVSLAAVCVHGNSPSDGVGAFVGAFFASLVFGCVCAYWLLNLRLRKLDVTPYLTTIHGTIGVKKLFFG